MPGTSPGPGDFGGSLGQRDDTTMGADCASFRGIILRKQGGSVSKRICISLMDDDKLLYVTTNEYSALLQYDKLLYVTMNED